MRLSEMLTQIDCNCTVVRDGAFQVLEQCTRIREPAALTYLENEKYIDTLASLDISCLLCTPELAQMVPNHIAGLAVTAAPKLAFFRIHNLLAARQEKTATVIDPSAHISPQAYVAPYNVSIGKDVELHPFVVINENTAIKNNVRICAGTIVGDQSFTSVPDGQGGAFLARDAGRTLIEEGVEICGSCHIACGTLENDITTIGAYTKLDSMVYIGHGAVLGKRVLAPSGALIAGNCIIGDDVWIGASATISNRIVVGERARVSIGSIVTKDVPAGATVTGNFAIPHQRFLQNLKESIKE